MTIDIENYRGQLIQYDEDYDKFICDISIEDKSKSVKRGSLKDLRKEIDAFVKVNLEFKPFKAISLGNSWDKEIIVINVKAIRADGKLVVNKGYRDEYIPIDEMKNCKVYDAEILDKQKTAKKIRADADKLFNDTIDNLKKELKPLDLSMYVSISEKKKESLTE